MSIQERILLWRIQRGPAAAFDAVYAEYGTRVYRFCHRLSGNTADAEDLTQEVFVAALGGLERFEGRASIATWLYRIAVLKHRTRIARQAKGAHAVSLDQLDSTLLAAPGSSLAALSDQRITLAGALEALPEAHRDAFLLVKSESLTCHEAADVLGIPEGTVKYHIHEAVSKLRELLSAETDTRLAPKPDHAPRDTRIQRSNCYELR